MLKQVIKQPIAKQVQAQLQISKPGDELEQQADVAAERVVNGLHAGQGFSSTGSAFSRKCAPCYEESGMKIHRKATPVSTSPLSASFSQQLSAQAGRGHCLNPGMERSMGTAFSADFSNVRIHTDPAAATMSNAIQARAFTYGADVYFNTREFNTQTTEGKKLLAHELAHVVQQGAGIQRRIMRQVPPGAVAAPRQDLVLVMGATGFHRVAERFFRPRYPQAHFVTNLTNLADALQHIANTYRTPLGNIFIVTHANEDGTVSFGLNSRDRDNHLSVVELRTALRSGANGGSSLPDVSAQVDAQTSVQIKGCDLGRNQQIVELFDQAFGGLGTVTAPTHEQVYGTLSSREIRDLTTAAMDAHMHSFETTLPPIPPMPAPIPRGLRGDALRDARAERTRLLAERAAVQRQHRQSMAAERRSYAAEASRLGRIAGSYDELSGPMFQRPGTALFAAADLQPQLDTLYPHLTLTQRQDIANALVAPDRRSRAAAHRQGTYRQSGQRAYEYNEITARYAAPSTEAEARNYFAGQLRRMRFTVTTVVITAISRGNQTGFEYAFAGTMPVRGGGTQRGTFNATSQLIDSDADLLQRARDRVNNPDKFSWRITHARNASGVLTKTVIRERVVCYLHHRTLNRIRSEHFDPAETDTRFYARSTFAPPPASP